MKYAIVHSIHSGPSGPVSFMPFETREEAVNKMREIKEKAIAEGKPITWCPNGEENFSVDYSSDSAIPQSRYFLVRKEDL